MPRSAPVRTSRFDLSSRYLVRGYHLFDGAEIQNHFTESLVDTERATRVIEYRSAGMWFKDIAILFGFSSASQASAYYIRECRFRNIDPIVRERQARRIGEILDTAGMDELPAFLDRSNFAGENEYTFGVEIETVGINHGQAQLALQQIQLACQNIGYTHSHTDQWKAVPDGSLSGRGGATEVVSRILKGKSGLTEMRKVMKALKGAGARTNRSTGMHVHLGVEPLGDRQLGLTIRLHCLFQNVFNTFIEERRRSSTYARPRAWSTALLTASEWARGNRSYSDHSRYYSLNLQSYDKYGTFEFRSYGGCLNPRRASAWIQLHMDFIEFCGVVAGETVGLVGADQLVLNDTTQSMIPKTWEFISGAVQPVQATEEIKEVVKEWVGDNSFITNPAVRQILKDEYNRLNPSEQI